MTEDIIVKALNRWETFEKTPNNRYVLEAYDGAKEPRPQGRYLLLTWDGQHETHRLYLSYWRRKIAYLQFKWRCRISKENW
jgi:hypothetical protein